MVPLSSFVPMERNPILFFNRIWIVPFFLDVSFPLSSPGYETFFDVQTRKNFSNNRLDGNAVPLLVNLHCFFKTQFRSRRCSSLFYKIATLSSVSLYHIHRLFLPRQFRNAHFPLGVEWLPFFLTPWTDRPVLKSPFFCQPAEAMVRFFCLWSLDFLFDLKAFPYGRKFFRKLCLQGLWWTVFFLLSCCR